MELNLAEKFLLLVFKPKTTKYLINEIQRNGGFVSAILLDLKRHRHLDIVNQKVQVISSTTQLSLIHQHALKTIASDKKDKKLWVWFLNLTHKAKVYQNEVLDNMAAKNIVQVEYIKRWFIKYKAVSLLKERERKELLHKVKQAVNQQYQEDDDIVYLLMLVRLCRAYKLLADDQQPVRQIKQRLKERFSNDTMFQTLDKSFRTMEGAYSG